jgi:hypothetical protein
MTRVPGRSPAVAFLILLSLVVLSPRTTAAQAMSGEAPAHVSAVEGTAVLEREGRPDASPTSMPILAGDRIRTEDGRVEVMFGDGSLLHLDARTTVDIQSEAVLRLTRGRIRLLVASGPGAGFSRVDTPGGWIEIEEPGEYRVGLDGDVRDPQVELAVLRGRARLLNEAGRTDLDAGERAFVRANLAPSEPYVLNSAALDDFDRWSEERRRDQRGVSAQYLPETVRPYAGTLDQYGSWRYEPTYGYVWYPAVAVGWRPYYRGRWVTYGSFGWTWVGADPWAWPTHHFGRWGFSAGAWFWIPGRQWGPAWVSWAYAPGYVSWCPLGFDNRAVIAFSIGGSYGHVRRVGYDPWRAWTVLPASRFGRGVVHTSVVAGARLDARVRSSFSVRTQAPAIRGYAVPRAAAPVYSLRGTPGPASTPAVRRGALAAAASPSAPGRIGAASAAPAAQRPPDARAGAGPGWRGSQAAAPRGAGASTVPGPAGAAGTIRQAVPRDGAGYSIRGAVPARPAERGPAGAPASGPPAVRRAPQNAPATTAPGAQPPPARPGSGSAPPRIYSAPGRSTAPAPGGSQSVPRAIPRSSGSRSYDARPADGGRGTYDAGRTYEPDRSYGASPRIWQRDAPAASGAQNPGGAVRRIGPPAYQSPAPSYGSDRAPARPIAPPSYGGSLPGAAVPRGAAPGARGPAAAPPAHATAPAGPAARPGPAAAAPAPSGGRTNGGGGNAAGHAVPRGGRR